MTVDPDIDKQIAEIKWKVDHRKLHPQEVHGAVYLLLGEIDKLRAEIERLRVLVPSVSGLDEEAA